MLCVLASLWQTTKPNAVIGGQQREKPDFSVHRSCRSTDPVKASFLQQANLYQQPLTMSGPSEVVG